MLMVFDVQRKIKEKTNIHQLSLLSVTMEDFTFRNFALFMISHVRDFDHFVHQKHTLFSNEYARAHAKTQRM